MEGTRSRFGTGTSRVEHATSRTPPVVATDGTGVVSHARDGADGLHPLGDECPGRGEPLGEQPLKAGLSVLAQLPRHRLPDRGLQPGTDSRTVRAGPRTVAPLPTAPPQPRGEAMTLSKLGYARVSTLQQNEALQHDALHVAGCDRIFTDKASGKLEHRPALDDLLGQVAPGTASWCGA